MLVRQGGDEGDVCLGCKRREPGVVRSHVAAKWRRDRLLAGGQLVAHADSERRLLGVARATVGISGVVGALSIATPDGVPARRPPALTGPERPQGLDDVVAAALLTRADLGITIAARANFEAELDVRSRLALGVVDQGRAEPPDLVSALPTVRRQRSDGDLLEMLPDLLAVRATGLHAWASVADAVRAVEVNIESRAESADLVDDLVILHQVAQLRQFLGLERHAHRHCIGRAARAMGDVELMRR